MALTQKKTQSLVGKYGQSDKDTGNAAVQIAIFSERIRELTEHLKKNKKDYSCQRGLLMMVGKRRRLLNYYRDTHTAEEYKELITALKIRK